MENKTEAFCLALVSFAGASSGEIKFVLSLMAKEQEMENWSDLLRIFYDIDQRVGRPIAFGPAMKQAVVGSISTKGAAGAIGHVEHAADGAVFH